MATGLIQYLWTGGERGVRGGPVKYPWTDRAAARPLFVVFFDRAPWRYREKLHNYVCN